MRRVSTGAPPPNTGGASLTGNSPPGRAKPQRITGAMYKETYGGSEAPENPAGRASEGRLKKYGSGGQGRIPMVRRTSRPSGARRAAVPEGQSFWPTCTSKWGIRPSPRRGGKSPARRDGAAGWAKHRHAPGKNRERHGTGMLMRFPAHPSGQPRRRKRSGCNPCLTGPDGKGEHATGWASEGGTAEKAYARLSRNRGNIRTGIHKNTRAKARQRAFPAAPFMARFMS